MEIDLYKEHIESIDRSIKKEVIYYKIQCSELRILVNQIIKDIDNLKIKKLFLFAYKKSICIDILGGDAFQQLTIGDSPFSALNYMQRQKDIKRAEDNITSLRNIYNKYDVVGFPSEYIDGLNKFSDFIDGLKFLKQKETIRNYQQKCKERVISDIIKILNNSGLNEYIKTSTFNPTTNEEYFLHKLCRLSINYKHDTINILENQEIKAFKKILSEFKTEHSTNKK